MHIIQTNVRLHKGIHNIHLAGSTYIFHFTCNIVNYTWIERTGHSISYNFEMNLWKAFMSFRKEFLQIFAIENLTEHSVMTITENSNQSINGLRDIFQME